MMIPLKWQPMSFPMQKELVQIAFMSRKGVGNA